MARDTTPPEKPDAAADSVFGSAMADAARRAGDHFAGRDADAPSGPEDRVELWGRRIGRSLSLAGCIALALYLYITYVR